MVGRRKTENNDKSDEDTHVQKIPERIQTAPRLRHMKCSDDLPRKEKVRKDVKHQRSNRPNM